jgi:ABC-2 type transport system ATP-binding protein
VIDKGHLACDESLDALARRMQPQKRLVLRLERPVPDASLAEIGSVVSHGDAEIVLDVPRTRVREAVARALGTLPVSDLVVEDPPLEEVMRELYAREAAPAASE